MVSLSSPATTAGRCRRRGGVVAAVLWQRPAARYHSIRPGTNLKLAEGYICHKVPGGPWSGRMKLWEPECTRSPPRPVGGCRQRHPYLHHHVPDRDTISGQWRGRSRETRPGKNHLRSHFRAKIISFSAEQRRTYVCARERNEDNDVCFCSCEIKKSVRLHRRAGETVQRIAPPCGKSRAAPSYNVIENKVIPSRPSSNVRTYISTYLSIWNVQPRGNQKITDVCIRVIGLC